MADQKLKMNVTPEYVEVFRTTTGKDYTPIVHWTRQEWEEDPDLVLPAIKTAVELYLVDPIRLLTILGFQNLILTDEPVPKKKRARKIDYENHGLKLDGCDYI